MFIIQLIYNLSTLIAASIISGFIDVRYSRNTLTGKILQGLLFGSIAILGMINPVVFEKGIIFDGRSIVLSLCGLFFGPVSGVISCTMAVVKRIFIGGSGALMGISVALESTIIGIIFYFLKENKKITLNNLNILLVGIIVHIFMIISMPLLPIGTRHQVFKQLALPVIIFYPIATLFIGKILIDQENIINLNKKLKEEQNKLKTLQQNIPGMIYKADNSWKAEIVTGSKELCGYKPEELMNKSWLEIIHYEDKERLIKESSQITPEKNHIVQEYRIIDKNNKIKWVSDHKTFIFDKKNNIKEVYGIVFDETEKIENEQLMRTLRKAIEESPISVVITDPYGKIQYANTKYTEITQYSFDELIMKYPKILEPGQISDEYYNMLEALQKGETWICEYIAERKDKTNIWERVTIFAIFDNNKVITNFVLLIEDITDRKQLIDELIKAKEKAEESDRLKSAFLANMSHEIRTPMNGIMGFAELLKNPELTSSEKDKYVEMILKSGKRMLDTLNDIISISKIDSGVEKIIIKDVNINHILEEIKNFYSLEAKSKGIEINLYKFLPDNKAFIRTDDLKLHSIINNLVKNAIKFTSKGKVDFGYWIENSSIIFYVKDTGKGISENFKDKLFQRFVQEEMGYTRMYEGSGLGLALAKAYVEMLNGQIWLEKSVINEGSEFRFKIPYSIGQNIEETSSKNIIKKNIIFNELTLLIAEDDDYSYEFLEILLKNQFKQILRAINGFEAIEIVKQNKVDLILMDIKMPLMDGYKATQKIREFNKDVIIIAQTAYAYPEDEIKAYQAGCNGYITKPIRKEVLIDLFYKLLKNKS